MKFIYINNIIIVNVMLIGSYDVFTFFHRFSGHYLTYSQTEKTKLYPFINAVYYNYLII